MKDTNGTNNKFVPLAGMENLIYFFLPNVNITLILSAFVDMVENSAIWMYRIW
jgi:hypothetical protein